MLKAIGSVWHQELRKPCKGSSKVFTAAKEQRLQQADHD